MTELSAAPDLYGMPVFTSHLVEPGEVVVIGRRCYVHSHLSIRGRKRRPHGRPRNVRREWKVRYVRYEPVLDRLREAA